MRKEEQCHLVKYFRIRKSDKLEFDIIFVGSAEWRNPADILYKRQVFQSQRKTRLAAKMLSDNWWSALIAIILIFGCDRTSSECVQLSPCSCRNEDGTGFDLSSLKHYGYLTAKDDPAKSNNTFYFHPCENYNKFPINQTSMCNTGNGVSLCMYNSNTTSVSLGTAEETTIVTGAQNQELILKNGKSTTIIELVCCESCTSPFFTVVDKEHLVLSMLKPCKIVLARGLSTGSLLVIMLFVFSGLYFIGGTIVIKLLKGATGWQMLPNHEFWLDLPALVKDGVTFCLNRCKTDSYDRI